MDSEFLVDAKPMSDDHSQKANNNLLFDDDLPQPSLKPHSTSSSEDFEHVNDDFLMTSSTIASKPVSGDSSMDKLLDLDKPLAPATNLVETLFTEDNQSKVKEEPKPFLENEFMQFSSTLKDPEYNFTKPAKDIYNEFMDAERTTRDSPEPLSSNNSSQTVSPAKVLAKVEDKVEEIVSKTAEKIDRLAHEDLLEDFLPEPPKPTIAPIPEPEIVMQPKFVPEPEPVPVVPMKVEKPEPKIEKPEPKIEKPEPKIEKPEPKIEQPSAPVPPVVSSVPKPKPQDEVTISAEEMFCKYGFDAWFKPSRLHPKVESLIYWRDVKKSGAVFGAGLIILLAISCFSVISVFAYVSLISLVGTMSFRIYKSVMQAIQKTSDGHPFKEYLDFELQLPQEKAQQIVGVAVSHVNSVLAELRRLFLVEDLIDSVKFAVMLWCLTYLGAWFNGMTLVILSYVALFTLPKVYENNKQSIDAYLDLVRSKIAEITEKVKAAIPIGKKVESEKDK